MVCGACWGTDHLHSFHSEETICKASSQSFLFREPVWTLWPSAMPVTLVLDSTFCKQQRRGLGPWLLPAVGSQASHLSSLGTCLLISGMGSCHHHEMVRGTLHRSGPALAHTQRASFRAVSIAIPLPPAGPICLSWPGWACCLTPKWEFLGCNHISSWPWISENR